MHWPMTYLLGERLVVGVLARVVEVDLRLAAAAVTVEHEARGGLASQIGRLQVDRTEGCVRDAVHVRVEVLNRPPVDRVVELKGGERTCRASAIPHECLKRKVQCLVSL